MVKPLQELIQTNCVAVGGGRISVASVVAALLLLSLTIISYDVLTIDAAVFAVAAGAILSAVLIAFNCMTTQNGNLKHLANHSIRGRIPSENPSSPIVPPRSVAFLHGFRMEVTTETMERACRNRDCRE